MTRILILVAALLLAGCDTLGAVAGKGSFRNRVSCTLGDKTMLFTSFWFRWLGVTAEVDAADAAEGCKDVTPVILQVAPRAGTGT